ncbi:MAG: N-acetyltransferase [Desulfobacteraceae bacterium]|nr:MAG: N-acetyltransferase [Desulfobacteraceae bacterium]
MVDLLPVRPLYDHYLLCRRWFENSETTKWLSSPLRLGRYHRLVHEKLISDRRNHVLFISVDSAPIGLVGLQDIDRIDHKAEIWYMVGEEQYRRKDLASQAVRKLNEFSAHHLNLASLYAHVSVFNLASIRVLEKSDYRYVGRLRRSFRVNGEYQDLLLYDWIPA